MNYEIEINKQKLLKEKRQVFKLQPGRNVSWKNVQIIRKKRRREVDSETRREIDSETDTHKGKLSAKQTSMYRKLTFKKAGKSKNKKINIQLNK